MSTRKVTTQAELDQAIKDRGDAMTPRNAYRIQPRDSMYPQDVPPFNSQAANDEPANEPRDLVDSWPFLAFLWIAGSLVYAARAFGWLP